MAHAPQADLLRIWRGALEGEKLHHAWLLAGSPSSGPGVFAMRAAAEVVEARSDSPPDFHPDILVVRREAKDPADGRSGELRRNITVAQIRALQQRLATRPSAGERRAIIIDPVDDLETSASNALLKSLEEPPAGTVFLLVSHHSARLLPTIRSRCRLLRFRRPGHGPSGEDDGDAKVMNAVRGLLKPSSSAIGAVAHLATGLGPRPQQSSLRLALRCAQDILAARLGETDRITFRQLDRALTELGRLEEELTSHNYDPDLTVARIATLLSGLAAPTDVGNG